MNNKNNNTSTNFWLLIYISTIYLYIRFNIEFSSIVYCDGPSSLSEFSMSYYAPESVRSENSYDSSSNWDAHNTSCLNFIYRYKNISRRRAYWNLFEKRKSNFVDYNDFKAAWDPNTSITYGIKTQLKLDIDSTLRKFSKTKRTTLWFLRGSNSNGGRGL